MSVAIWKKQGISLYHFTLLVLSSIITLSFPINGNYPKIIVPWTLSSEKFSCNLQLIGNKVKSAQFLWRLKTTIILFHEAGDYLTPREIYLNRIPLEPTRKEFNESKHTTFIHSAFFIKERIREYHYCNIPFWNIFVNVFQTKLLLHTTIYKRVIKILKWSIRFL